MTSTTHALPHPEQPDRPSSGSWALDGAVCDLRHAVVAVGERLLDLPREDDSDHLLGRLHLLADLRDLRTILHQAEASMEARLAQAIDTDRAEFPGMLVERKGGAKRTAWDNDRVASRLTQEARDRASVDVSTGDVDEQVAQAVQEALDLVWEAVRPNWRVTALRRLGVRYDDACETEYGRRTLHVSRGELPTPGEDD